LSTPEATPPWRISPAGLLVAVRLTPRGGKDALGSVEALSDGKAVLTARVRAAPTEGEANRALVKLIAKALKVPASRVSIVQGASSRIKIVQIEGDGSALQRSLLTMIG
jgi:uncharacterized protein (TIGR00251 family)